MGELLLEGDVLLWQRAAAAGAGAGRKHPLATRLKRYFSGTRDDFADVQLDLSWCTPFQHAVVDAPCAASAAERPSRTASWPRSPAIPARRARPGSFCAHNRFGIIVPCHRVVAAAGLGGYGSLGADYKRRLLALEGAA